MSKKQKEAYEKISFEYAINGFRVYESGDKVDPDKVPDVLWNALVRVVRVHFTLISRYFEKEKYHYRRRFSSLCDQKIGDGRPFP